jgi:hypothetical protein
MPHTYFGLSFIVVYRNSYREIHFPGLLGGFTGDNEREGGSSGQHPERAQEVSICFLFQHSLVPLSPHIQRRWMKGGFGAPGADMTLCALRAL